MPMQHANLNNLKNLWHSYGPTAIPSESNGQILVHNRWPYRCWFEADGENPNIARLLQQLPTPAVVPVWPGMPAGIEARLQQQRWHCAFEQTAMFLPLPAKLPGLDVCNHNFASLPIHTPVDINHWCAIGSEAFGYTIDTGIISRLANSHSTRLYLDYLNGLPVACALLHKTDNTIGLHQFGIARNFQGLGLARRFMHQLIREAESWQAKQLVLQASAAGLPLYTRLGFQPQFTIRNYQRL